MTSGTTKLLADIAAGNVSAANAGSQIDRAGGADLVILELFRSLAENSGGTDPLTILASQAQAEAGTANDVLMTPLRTKEAVTALALLKSGGTLTGALTLPDGSASAPSLRTLSSSANNIGIFGSSASIIFTAYGSSQMAFATSWNGSGLAMQTNFTLDWTASSSPTSSPDLIVGRGGAAATLQLGRNHATTPTAQVFKAHNVTTGTGASLEIAGGTGSVARGNVILRGARVILAETLPTSASGLATGTIWNDGGTLKVA